MGSKELGPVLKKARQERRWQFVKFGAVLLTIEVAIGAALLVIGFFSVDALSARLSSQSNRIEEQGVKIEANQDRLDNQEAKFDEIDLGFGRLVREFRREIRRNERVPEGDISRATEIVAVSFDTAVGGAGRCLGEPVTRTGSSGPDFIEGTPGRDVINGRAGDDAIFGYGRNDRICGRAGADAIVGGDGGRDRVDGGSEADACDAEFQKRCES